MGVKNRLGEVHNGNIVTKFMGTDKRSNALWEFKCIECGSFHTVKGYVLPTTKSCGCIMSTMGERVGAKTKHGMVGHPAYVSWRAMIARCTYAKDIQFHNYGGRGIKVCREWLGSFNAFWLDMEDEWFAGGTIERKNVDGNYEPSNCTWASRLEQAHNKRS